MPPAYVQPMPPYIAPAPFGDAPEPLAYTQGVNAEQPEYWVDVSLENPDQQFEYLVGMIENYDQISPSPFTGTPPWGEPVDPSDFISDAVLEENYLPAPDVEAAAAADLDALQNDAAVIDIPERTWWNDDQYMGLGVPPGVQNTGQAIETGHTQIIRNDPAAEHGWDAWSGRPQLARVARHENSFPQYSAGTSRGHEVAVEKFVVPYAFRTQQYRDLLLSELNRRGIHNVVIADVPSVPYTEEVAVVDPTVLAPQPDIGPEGVLPW